MKRLKLMITLGAVAAGVALYLKRGDLKRYQKKRKV